MNIKAIFTALGIVAVIYLALLFGAKGTSLFSFGINTNPQSQLQVNSTDLVPQVQATAGSQEKFDYLSVQRSSTCGLQPEIVTGYPDDQRIQGSCCSPMDLHRYQEQVEGLKKYSSFDLVPEDPYDILASLAKRLFDYQKNITLNAQQQAIYDKAVELSDEGGPCCCKCWRWYAFEGQAKYLIRENSWTAEKIAQLWGIEDGCGGAGHSHEGDDH